MKKLLFTALAVFAFVSVNAQEDESSALSKGSWLVEANTGFGESSTANTAFALRSVDGTTAWAIGGEAGYFIDDNLAIKAGLGYGDAGVDGIDGTFNFKVGAKYYIDGQFPVQLDLNGASGNDVTPLWAGLQAGYAWFVADNVSIEPGLRYGLGLNEDSGDGDFNVFSVNIGFAIHF